MTDRSYTDLRAALDANPKGDKWMCVKYGPKTLGVGISGGPALFMVREGSYTDIDDARKIVHNLLIVREQARSLLADYEEASARAFYETSVAEAAIEQVKKLEADYDRLREALLWNAAALNECCKECIREASNITIADETKSFSEILDMADAALAQEQGESDGH